MKAFFAFIKKEFFHIMRDPKTLVMLLGVPVAQILLYGFALTNEIKNAKVLICDLSNDLLSRQVVLKIASNPYFSVVDIRNDVPEFEKIFKEDIIKLIVVIPDKLETFLSHENSATIQVVADASDPNTANTLIAYLNAIIGDYQQLLMGVEQVPYNITPQISMFYNPELLGAPNFVPGVMALVLMLVCVMMTSVAIVKEKEMGTIENLLVSPFNPFMILVAKMVPYLLVSFCNIVIILAMSWTLLDLPVQGSILLLVAESMLLIITALSIGLFVSTIADSQLTAMLISAMGMMLPTTLFSGFLFPVENMVEPLQIFANIVPSRWYYIIVKDVMIKGEGFMTVWKETLILILMTVVVLCATIAKFKNRLE